jgi:hypothetical protein
VPESAIAAIKNKGTKKIDFCAVNFGKTIF